MKLRETEVLVAEKEFVLSSGTRVTGRIVDDENTIRDPDGVARCRAEMERVASNIFRNAEMRERGA